MAAKMNWLGVQLACMVLLQWCTQARATISPDNMKQLSNSNADFAFALLRQTCKANQTGNAFLSPQSITTALGMTLLGAKGQTKSQLEKAMRFDQLGEKVREIFKEKVHEILRELNGKIITGSENYTIDYANKLFGQKGHTFIAKFLNDSTKYYGAPPMEVDFAGNTSESIQLINDWVEKRTENNIRNLVSEDIVKEDTKLVLVNAIYFMANWKYRFPPPEGTQNFSIGKGLSESVPMLAMANQLKHGHSDTLKSQILELPYESKVSMFIILPDAPDGAKDLVMTLTSKNLNEAVAEMSLKEVHVKLPKFTITHHLKLKTILQSMNVTDLFENRADLSGMTGHRDLFLVDVVHQAYVDVNEEGTMAAAATAGVAETKSNKKMFFADHPFVFFIREEETGAILFLGKVVNPKKTNMMARSLMMTGGQSDAKKPSSSTPGDTSTSGKAPVNTSIDASADTSIDASADTSNDASADTSNDASADTTMKALSDNARTTLKGTASKNSGDTTKMTTGESSGSTPEPSSESTASTPPGKTSSSSRKTSLNTPKPESTVTTKKPSGDSPGKTPGKPSRDTAGETSGTARHSPLLYLVLLLLLLADRSF